MQKFIHWICFGILLFVLSCSDDLDDETMGIQSLSFDESSIPENELSFDGGTTDLKIKWAHLEWNIEAGDVLDGHEFISIVSPSRGGLSESEITSTTVTLLYDSNTASAINRQQLILSSTDHLLSDTIILTQAAYTVHKINLTLNPNTTYQTITGFGGANMIWGSDYLNSEEMNLAFGTDENGMGLSIIRVRLSSDKNDWEGLVSTIKEANQYGALVLASPWSPPAQWKSNNSTDGGGYLLEEHYADFAVYINEFIQFMSDQGATVDVVSIQNEPDWKAGYEGCEYTALQMYDFVKNYAGIIQGAKVLAAESLNSNHAYTDDILNDSEAMDNLDIVGGHLYGSGLAPYELAGQKGKELWMTEHLLNLDSGNNPDNWTAYTDTKTIWDETMTMIQEIHTAMTYNWNAYIWWYIRRYYSFLGDGEKGTTRGEILKRGCAMSHFSKFIRPGYIRIEALFENSSDQLNVSAYEGDDEIVVVIINSTDSSVPGVNLIAPSEGLSAEAYCTSELNNMSMIQLTQEDLNFMLEVPANSITTIVMKSN